MRTPKRAPQEYSRNIRICRYIPVMFLPSFLEFPILTPKSILTFFGSLFKIPIRIPRYWGTLSPKPEPRKVDCQLAERTDGEANQKSFQG